MEEKPKPKCTGCSFVGDCVWKPTPSIYKYYLEEEQYKRDIENGVHILLEDRDNIDYRLPDLNIRIDQ